MRPGWNAQKSSHRLASNETKHLESYDNDEHKSGKCSKLPAGRYQYRFLVDGEWRDDPECMVRLPNPYGSHNMVRIVPQVRQEPIRSVSIPIARLEECWPGRNPTNNAQPVSFGP